MMQGQKGIKAFDAWIQAFVKHVTAKGVVPGSEDAERSAQTTTTSGPPSGRPTRTSAIRPG